jgi:hypothetical protein
VRERAWRRATCDARGAVWQGWDVNDGLDSTLLLAPRNESLYHPTQPIEQVCQSMSIERKGGRKEGRIPGSRRAKANHRHPPTFLFIITQSDPSVELPSRTLHTYCVE